MTVSIKQVANRDNHRARRGHQYACSCPSAGGKSRDGTRCAGKCSQWEYQLSSALYSWSTADGPWRVNAGLSLNCTEGTEDDPAPYKHYEQVLQTLSSGTTAPTTEMQPPVRWKGEAVQWFRTGNGKCKKLELGRGFRDAEFSSQSRYLAFVKSPVGSLITSRQMLCYLPSRK